MFTPQTHRQHREEQARLLEENASLKARIAAEAARVAMGVLPGSGPKTFKAVGESEGVSGVVEAWLGKLERWVLPRQQLLVQCTAEHAGLEIGSLHPHGVASNGVGRPVEEAWLCTTLQLLSVQLVLLLLLLCAAPLNQQAATGLVAYSGGGLPCAAGADHCCDARGSISTWR